MNNRLSTRVLALCLAAVVAIGQPAFVCAVACLYAGHHREHQVHTMTDGSHPASATMPCHGTVSARRLAARGALGQAFHAMPIRIPHVHPVAVGEIVTNPGHVRSPVHPLETPPPRHV